MTTPDNEHTGGRAVLIVMVGTGVIGLSGLLILAVTARVLGAADYAAFGVFWSAVFFVVAVLFGAQQESTRAIAQSDGRSAGSSLIAFALVLGSATAVLVLASSPVWRPATLDRQSQVVVAVAIGGLAYALTGVIAGALAGAGRWAAYASMLIAEGASRLLLVVVVIAVVGGVAPLAWAVVAAYPVALLAAVLALRQQGLRLRVDDSIGKLLGNTLKTMAAAASVAALVNGFPLLMSTFARGATESSVGALTLAVMLTRAPLLVPLMALQSLLIKRFSEVDHSLMGMLIRLVLGCVVVAAMLGLVAAAIGPGLLRSFFGAEFELPGHTLGLLVLSSGLIGALSMSSPALVARNLHGQNVIGWVSAVAVSVLILAFEPSDLEVRVPFALLAGPLVGLMLHLVMVHRMTVARLESAP